MKTFQALIAESLQRVEELFPWDLAVKLEADSDILLVDIREPYEFDAMHIRGSLNVPRGILEMACEYDYEETVPELADAREREIVLVCRSGNRSIFAADVMQQMGYSNVRSLKTGMRGWSDYEQEMVDAEGNVVDEDTAIDYFTPNLKPEQLSKKA
jgi:rhodanese-related sulfurtransferase